MSTYSIVIPAYNAERWLVSCLNSLKSQDFADWEAIVVVDGATDKTLEIANSFSIEDSRFTVLNKGVNEGRHLARKSGVLKSSGSYVLFLDADDELETNALSQLNSCVPLQDGIILHFGVNCFAAEGFASEDASKFSDWANSGNGAKTKFELLDSMFSSRSDLTMDWNIHHRLFPGDLARSSFAQMTDARLDFGEDGYEMLVLAHASEGELYRNDLKLYNYFIGRGVTNNRQLSFDEYAQLINQVSKTLDESRSFCDKFEIPTSYYDGFAFHLQTNLMNDWCGRLSEEDKLSALPLLQTVLPTAILAEGTMRLARDVFYTKYVNGESVSNDDLCVCCYQFADRLARVSGTSPLFDNLREAATSHLSNIVLGNIDTDSLIEKSGSLSSFFCNEYIPMLLCRKARDRAYELIQSGKHADETDYCFRAYEAAVALEGSLGFSLPKEYQSLRYEALVHLCELERQLTWASSSSADAPTISSKSEYDEQSIRIFVTTHKDVNLFKSNILQPVQVGTANPRKRLLWAYQDDEGDNIANLNAMYCELTTQYWAWKNVDAEYYGFCHYRRYFDFSSDVHEENPYGEIIDQCIDWDSQKRYALSDELICKSVEGYDIITTGIKDLNSFPECFENPEDQYSRAPYLHIGDLHRVIKILKQRYPDYAEDADAYLTGHMACFCNMYIMRKKQFFSYCNWMFPILEQFIDDWDTSKLSREALRTPGHLSERLFNIWLIHQKRVSPVLKCKEVQCVHFEKPEHLPKPQLEPADSHGLPVVPVVFAADNNYVPMVTTTAFSMLKNASRDSFYDVVILEKDFSEYNKRIMTEFFGQFENASVRFVNVAGMISAYNLQTSNEHISVETYYRFLIQKILPGYDKVIYLDSDLIVKGDVSELYATDLETNLLAAARDIDYLGNLNMNDGKRMEYTKEVLQMENPYDYFQAGVLVLNTAEMRKLYSFEKWLEIAAEPKYIYDDQDILNAHCQGRVTYLDNSWNVMNDCGGRTAKVFSFAPAGLFDKYIAAYQAPKIMHYAGFEKPWKPGPCDQKELYWSYARQMPFYESLLSMVFIDKNRVAADIQRSQDDAVRLAKTPARAISENSPLREVFDEALPQGSTRREVAKLVVRKLRGRK